MTKLRHILKIFEFMTANKGNFNDNRPENFLLQKPSFNGYCGQTQIHNIIMCNVNPPNPEVQFYNFSPNLHEKRLKLQNFKFDPFSKASESVV